jgi:PII-like signaling protein
MRRYLIVANRTLGGQQLLDHVRSAASAGPASFHVLVPVYGDDPRGHEAAVAAARERLDAELARLRGVGAEVDGEIGDADPFAATQQLLQRTGFDEILVCTLPPGLSQWLGLDLVRRLERQTATPLTHIVTPAGMPARITGRAVRVSIYVGESDRHGHRPLYSEIVRRARELGLAGATVLRGVEGFGASSVIHTARLLTMSEDLPMVVVLIDAPDRIEAFLPHLDDLITEGLVVREDVDIVKYAGRLPPED